MPLVRSKPKPRTGEKCSQCGVVTTLKNQTTLRRSRLVRFSPVCDLQIQTKRGKVICEKCLAQDLAWLAKEIRKGNFR